MFLVVVTIRDVHCEASSRPAWVSIPKSGLITVSGSALGKDHLPPQTLGTALLLEEAVAPLQR